jgi:excisionase family DNA binding protein
MFTVQQLADRMAISTKTVRRWIESGELRSHKFDRRVVIAEDDAVAFVGARRR